MAVDFEVNDSTDWGDNGSLHDLHSVLFDNKVSHSISTNGSEQGNGTKKKHRKKKRSRTDDTSDSKDEIVEVVMSGEGIKRKQKHKKQDQSEITTKLEKAEGKQKAKKRKRESDSQQVDKKKKTLDSKNAVKRKIKQVSDGNKELINESETVGTAHKEGKKKKQKKIKVNDTEDGTKPTEPKEKDPQDHIKRKKKKKKKAVNKFKTEEFLNKKKLCGKFVDLTAPPPKIHKKDTKISPNKENHSDQSIGQPNIKNKQQPKVCQKDKKDKKQRKEKQKEKFQEQQEEHINRNDVREDGVKKSIETESKKKKPIDLRTKMENKLKGARFRFINEKLYTCTGDLALELFREDKEAFQVYHDGFVEQVKSWPVNPVDTMIADLQKMPPSKVVGDFGCGDAKIAQSVKQKVYSFDLVATKDNVIACNMANVPLSDGELDVAVFCLSLMGTNWIDYLKEANRVLKNKGMLKISEVSSRFQNLKAFILAMKRLGFSQIHKDTSNKFFISFDFKKQSSPKDISEGMSEILKPCLYKRR